MSVITRVPEPNIWEEICRGYSLGQDLKLNQHNSDVFFHGFHKSLPPIAGIAYRWSKEEFGSRARLPLDDDQMSVATDYSDFSATKHHPTFYGHMHARVPGDFDGDSELDPAVSHPACLGYAFTDKPPKPPTPPGPPPPDKDKCPPRQYLEHYVFPYLLPALEAMLKQARIEKCFERKRTKFNALDFITEYLYRRNPKFSDRGDTELLNIPFVKEWLKDHPRPPLPLSLLWTEEEAALIIQSYWRGYLARREPEIQELRQWQREWREVNGNIHSRVSDFWDSKLVVAPSTDGGEAISSLSVNYRPASPLPDSTTPTLASAPLPPPASLLLPPTLS